MSDVASNYIWKSIALLVNFPQCLPAQKTIFGNTHLKALEGLLGKQYKQKPAEFKFFKIERRVSTWKLKERFSLEIFF